MWNTLLCLAWLAPACTAETAYVHAPAVDLHAQPDDASPRLGTLQRGTPLRVRRYLGDTWAEIDPPDSAWGWVDASAVKRTPNSPQLTVSADYTPVRPGLGRDRRRLGPITELHRIGDRLTLVDARPLVDRDQAPPITYLPVELDPRYPWYVRRESLNPFPPRDALPRGELTSGWPQPFETQNNSEDSSQNPQHPRIMLSIAPPPARAELANRIFPDERPGHPPAPRRTPDASGTLLSSSRLVEGERAWVLIDPAGQIAAFVLVPTGFDPKRWNGRKVELFGEVHFSETHHVKIIRARQIEPAPPRR
jgi:hypothetical protein